MTCFKDRDPALAQQGLALAHDLAAVPHCDEHTGNPHVGTRTTQAADLSAHALETVKDKTVDLRGDNHLVTGKQRVDARHGVPRGTIEDAVVRAVVILCRADETIRTRVRRIPSCSALQSMS